MRRRSSARLAKPDASTRDTAPAAARGASSGGRDERPAAAGGGARATTPAARAAPDAPMALAETIAASELNYDRLLAWNDRYDAKVSLVLTLDTAMLGGLGVLRAEHAARAPSPCRS